MTVRFCYNCYQEREAHLLERDCDVKVRGDKITVRAQVFVCDICREEIANPETDDLLLTMAYREYRKQHGLLQPEEIAGLRTKLGLSQRALARLLGWGQITVQRYESGSLQDASHNMLLVQLNDPATVLRLIESATCKLTDTERKDLLGRIDANADSWSQERTVACLEERLTQEDPSEFTGFRRPSLERLGKMAIYFAHCLKDELFKVKLMKLLFYADFLHFARQGVSISGFPYARLEMGPVPDRHQHFLVWMEDVGYARIDEVPTWLGVGEALIPTVPPDLSDFTPAEIQDIETVLEQFRKTPGSELKEISHREPAWINTAPRARISYKWAYELRALH